MQRPTSLVAIPLAIVVAVGGCAGGDDPDGSAPPEATVSSTRQPTSTTTTSIADQAFLPGRRVVSFTVDGVRRSAVLVVPSASASPHPLVFVFHGHGGAGAFIERRVDIEGLWPDAIVVYPDGLAGHTSQNDPTGAEPGWQTRVGESDDRDLAFFDAMLATLRADLPVDDDRVYLIGHSNGSQFASLVLAERGAAIAAIANIAAQPGPRLLADAPMRSRFMVMGEEDQVVPYAVQQRSIPLVEAQLGADPEQASVDGFLRIEPAAGNVELAVFVHPGGHEIPAAVPPLVVEFFRRHTRNDV